MIGDSKYNRDHKSSRVNNGRTVIGTGGLIKRPSIEGVEVCIEVLCRVLGTDIT